MSTRKDWRTGTVNSAEIERSWREIDLAPILAGEHNPPKPIVGQRSDGVGLFYPSKVHTLAQRIRGR